MKEVLLDTDTISYYIKGDIEVTKSIVNYLNYYDCLNISIINYYEVLSGLKFKNANKQQEIFDNFINENKIIPITINSIKISAEIYAELRKSGTPVDDVDILIAGIAIENDFTLISNNQKHFSKISDLKLDNWKIVKI
jgi:tRNA(fMet)-specific endonuclease VapC